MRQPSVFTEACMERAETPGLREQAARMKCSLRERILAAPRGMLLVPASAMLTLLAGVSPSWAADLSPATCPGAAAWSAAHPDASADAMKRRDAARTLSRPDVLQALRVRVDADQSARRQMLVHPGSARATRAVRRIDDEDVAWLTRLLKGNGFPRVDQIGEVGLHLTWLLVQHADRDPPLQRLALVAFRRLHAAGEFSGGDLARLEDRVLVNQNRPQRYGTQFDWTSGHFDPRPIDDPEGVDARRHSLGLMPLADYACMMNASLARLAR